MTTIPTHPQLSEREHLFVEAIVSGATRAAGARAAGYGSTPQSQRVQGSRMMKRFKITHAIDKARKARDQQESNGGVMNDREVLVRLTELARHGETERIRLDAIGQMARHYSLFSDTLRLEQDQRRQDENERLAEKLQGRVQQVLDEREARERREERDGKAH